MDVHNPEEVLNVKDIYLSIYNGVVNTDKRKEYSGTKKDWELQLRSIQDWFIRCSWINKYLYLEALCESTSGCSVPVDLLKCLENIMTKDVLESFSNSPVFAYDVIPADDNHCLPFAEVEKTAEDTILWFATLKPIYQMYIILELTRVGGGGLMFNIYKLLVNIYSKRRQESSEREKWKAFTENTQKKNNNVFSESSKQTVRSKISDESSSENWTDVKQKLLQRRNSDLIKYQKSKGIFADDLVKVTKKLEVKESVDFVQILPICVNRKIMSYVDEKSLALYKKVNRYWGKMIDECINEKSGRRAINAKINKIIGGRLEKPFEKSSENKLEVGGEKENEKKEEIEEEEEEEAGEDSDSLTELGTKELFKKKNERSLRHLTKVCYEIFSRKCQTIKLQKNRFPDRVCCCDKKVEIMACTTPSNVVNFYSLRTGAKLNFSAFGFDSPITSLALHESRMHVIVGCKNGTLLSKVTRTNRDCIKFNGHTAAVKSLLTTSSNLLSSSADNNVRFFQMWSGVCLLCVDLSQEFSVNCLLIEDGSTSWTAIGTKEGVLLLIDLEKKKFTKKMKIHSEGITQISYFEDILITATERGEIRVWDIEELKMNSNTPVHPFYTIKIEDFITSLTFYNYQIFLGTSKGTIKIISLANADVFKTLTAFVSVAIKGLVVNEDKFCVKMIIWHENEIEMRTFPLLQLHKNGKSMKKNDEKSTQKAPEETGRNGKFSRTVFAGFVKNSQEAIKATANAGRPSSKESENF